MNEAHAKRVLAFPEEEKAKDLLNYLSWAAPLGTLVASLVDLILVGLYQKNFHPWGRLLAGEERDPTYRRITSAEQYQMAKRRSCDSI